MATDFVLHAAPVSAKAVAPKAAEAPAQRVIARWVELFRAHVADERPAITGKDAAAAKHLVDLVGADLVIARLPAYFALDDAYLRASGFPLALLPAAWNRLIVLTRPEPVGDEADRTLAYVRRLRGASIETV